MKYLGSKARIVKYMLPIILKNRKEGQWYVEPFVGGCNVIDKVSGNRIGGDVNRYAISLFKALQIGWVPPKHVSEDLYKKVKLNMRNYSDYLVGYIGFNSYGGKFFGGYRRDSLGVRDYWDEHFRNVMKQKNNIRLVHFVCSSYASLVVPDNSIIYCDPPYEGTTGYYNCGINYFNFWEWCRNMHALGHDIFISSYSAPSDFICLWAKPIKNCVALNTGGKLVYERLFSLRRPVDR